MASVQAMNIEAKSADGFGVVGDSRPGAAALGGA